MSQRIEGRSQTFLLTTEQMAEIARIAKKRKMKKAQVVRMLMDAGLTAHRDLERVGVIKMIDLVSWVAEASKEKSKEYEVHQLDLPL